MCEEKAYKWGKGGEGYWEDKGMSENQILTVRCAWREQPANHQAFSRRLFPYFQDLCKPSSYPVTCTRSPPEKQYTSLQCSVKSK